MNLLQVVSEKISKKQIIVLFGIWIVKDMQATPETKAICITIMVLAGVLLQWNLDRGKQPSLTPDIEE